MMKYRNIGGLNASAVALGCMRMGEKSPQEAEAAIQAALDSGINFFDHADIYGGGSSEERFGEAVRALGIDRDAIIVQGKCGIKPGQSYCFEPDYLLDAVDGILERLQMDYLDILLLHRPDALMEPDLVGEVFAELHAKGKVRAFGVSNMNVSQMALLQSGCELPLLVNQLQFSLMHTPMIDEGFNVNLTRDAGTVRGGGLLEFARLEGVTIQAWSPLQFGFIEGAFVDHPDYPEVNEALAKLAEKYGVSKSAIALAWILRHPADMQVLVGSMTPEHIRDAAKAADVELGHSEWYDLYLAGGRELP